MNEITKHIAESLIIMMINRDMDIPRVCCGLNIDPFTLQQYLRGTYDLTIMDIVRIELFFDVRLVKFGTEIDE